MVDSYRVSTVNGRYCSRIRGGIFDLMSYIRLILFSLKTMSYRLFVALRKNFLQYKKSMVRRIISRFHALAVHPHCEILEAAAIGNAVGRAAAEVGSGGSRA